MSIGVIASIMRPMSGPSADSQRIWRTLLDVARWAPSPHNTQPWLLEVVDSERAELFMVRKRRLPDEDTTGCFLICAMGIFIEAMRIVAANRGMTLEATCRNDLDYTREHIPFATLTLRPGGVRDEFSDRALLDRRTSRLPNPEPLPQATEARMGAIATAHEHALHIIHDSTLVAGILDKNVEAVLHDLSDRAYGGEIRTWYRYTQEDAVRKADGLEARCMNLPRHEMWLSARFPWTMRMPGLRRIMKALYHRRVGGASRLFMLSGPFFDRVSAERAGTMLLRLWLALHEGGGGMHPFGNLVTNPDAHTWLRRVTGIENVWLVARFGRTAPPPRSHRLPVEELLRAT